MLYYYLFFYAKNMKWTFWRKALKKLISQDSAAPCSKYLWKIKGIIILRQYKFKEMHEGKMNRVKILYKACTKLIKINQNTMVGINNLSAFHSFIRWY